VTPFTRKIRLILVPLWLTPLLLWSGCAWFMPAPTSPPFDPQEADMIASTMERQGEAAHSMVSSGTVTLETQGTPSEAQVLIVARREPSAVMIEVTHAWGQPLLRIQVNGTRLDVISFPEKRHYHGRLGSPWMLKHIPFPLDLDIIWSLARAYPVLPPYHAARSMKGDQVTLVDKADTPIQRVDLYPDSRLPRKVRWCRNRTSIEFSDFQEQDGIPYATNIQVSDDQKTSLLTLRIREMAVNRPLPETVFRQEAPPGFEVTPL
jgi:hypothetical protein